MRQSTKEIADYCYMYLLYVRTCTVCVGTKSEMELLEGQFLIEEWTPAFLGGRTPLASCDPQEPPAKRQKKAARGKENQKQATEKAEKKGQRKENGIVLIIATCTCITIVLTIIVTVLYTVLL